HVVEGDVVGHASGIGRDPGVHALARVAQAQVELGGALGLHAGEGIGRAVGAAIWREQLPVVGHAPGMADAGVPAQRAAVDVLLEAHEGRGQGFGAGLAQRRVGHRHHAAGAGAPVFDLGPVDARTGDHVVAWVEVPVQLGEGAGLAEARIHLPGLRQILAASRRAAPGVPAAARVHARGQVPALAADHEGRAAAAGAVGDVAGHRHRHRAIGIGLAQAVVVHHVVDVVVVDVGGEFAQPAFHPLLLEAQAVAGAVELRAVHAAPGVARLAVAGADAGFEHGIRIGCPAEGRVRVPLVPGRRHAPSGAVLVVARFGAVGGQPSVHGRVAGHGVDHLVVAAMAAEHRAAVQAQAGLVEIGDLALEAHRARRGAAAPEHRLGALDDGQAV